MATFVLMAFLELFERDLKRRHVFSRRPNITRQLNIFFFSVNILHGGLETVDTTQQVTSQSPKKHEKKTKRVAAGKAIAEKTRLAREAQKKALDEAKAIIANNNIQTPKAANEAPEANNNQDSDPETILTTTQWLSVINIFLSMVGIYYKRGEIKALFVKKNASSQYDSSQYDSSQSKKKKRN